MNGSLLTSSCKPTEPFQDAMALRFSILSVVLSLGALALSEWMVRRTAPGAGDA